MAPKPLQGLSCSLSADRAPWLHCGLLQGLASVGPACAWCHRHFVLNYVAAEMTRDSGVLPCGVTTFPYQHKHGVSLPAKSSPPPPPSWPSTPGSFYCRLLLHLLPRDTLIVPTAINTSLSMWQPCVPQSPSQRSHWPGDCEKVQQAQDPHIHMEIWVYKYRLEAERRQLTPDWLFDRAGLLSLSSHGTHCFWTSKLSQGTSHSCS